MTRRDAAAAFVVALAWGVNFVVIDVGLETFPPILFVALRFFFTAVPAVFFVRRPDVRVPVVLSVALLVCVGQFGLLFFAMSRGVPAGLASLILQLQAVFTILFATALLHERPSPRQLAGVGVAIGGVALIGAGRAHGVPLGACGLCVLAAASWGAGNVVTRASATKRPLALLVWSSLAASPVLAAVSLAAEGSASWSRAAGSLDAAAVLSLGYVVVVATFFGFGVWTWLLSRHPASSVAPFTLLVPVSSIASAWLARGERPSADRAGRWRADRPLRRARDGRRSRRIACGGLCRPRRRALAGRRARRGRRRRCGERRAAACSVDVAGRSRAERGPAPCRRRVACRSELRPRAGRRTRRARRRPRAARLPDALLRKRRHIPRLRAPARPRRPLGAAGPGAVRRLPARHARPAVHAPRADERGDDRRRVGVFSWVVPTYAKTVLGIATGRIGLLLLVNAAIVVVAQVPVARALEGRRRAPSLALACVAWAVAYAFVAAAPRAGGAAYGLLVVASVLVAVGECLHAVALFPLAAQLAPPQLRGRYMATIGLSFLAGLAAGPTVGVQLLARSPLAAFWSASGLALVAVASVLVLERALPDETRRTPRPLLARVARPCYNEQECAGSPSSSSPLS